MSTATAIVGISLASVSLVILLVSIATITRARRKRAPREPDETPEDEYRRAVRDLYRMRADSRRDSDRKEKRQSGPYGGSWV